MQLLERFGDDARAALVGYTKNGTGSNSEEFQLAPGLASSEVALLIVPKCCNVAGAKAEEIGNSAIAILVAGREDGPTRVLLYIHVRRKGRGDGHADRLLQKAKVMFSSLSVVAASWMTWHASLMLVRNGFVGDAELFSTDIPVLAERTTPASHTLSSLTWSQQDAPEEHRMFLAAACIVQLAYGTLRAQEYAKELRDISQLLYGALHVGGKLAACGQVATSTRDCEVEAAIDDLVSHAERSELDKVPVTACCKLDWGAAHKAQWSKTSGIYYGPHGLRLRVRTAKYGRGLFTLNSGKQGRVLGNVWGEVIGDTHARLEECVDSNLRGKRRRKKVLAIASNARRSWRLVDLKACVFGWMNCSRGRNYGNVRVTESGRVQYTRDVKAGEELKFWYGDRFVL